MSSPYFSPKHAYHRASPVPPLPFTNQKITSAIKPYESEVGLVSRYNDSTGTGLTGLQDPEFQKKVNQRKKRGAEAMQELIMTFKNEQISKEDLMRRIEEVHFREDISEELQKENAWKYVRAAQCQKNQQQLRAKQEANERKKVDYHEENEKHRLMELKKYYFQEYLKLKEKCQELEQNFFKIDKIMSELDTKSQLSSPKSTTTFAMQSPRAIYQRQSRDMEKKKRESSPQRIQAWEQFSPSIKPSIHSQLNFDYKEYYLQRKEEEISEHMKIKQNQEELSNRMNQERYDHLMRAKEMIVKRERQKQQNKARISVGSGSPSRLKTLTEQSESSKSKLQSPVEQSSPTMKKYRSQNQLRLSSEVIQNSSGNLKKMVQMPERHFRVPSDTSEFDSEIVNHERVYKPEKRIKVYAAQPKQCMIQRYEAQASPPMSPPKNCHVLMTHRSPNSGQTTKRSSTKPPLATKYLTNSKLSLKKLQKESDAQK